MAPANLAFTWPDNLVSLQKRLLVSSSLFLLSSTSNFFWHHKRKGLGSAFTMVFLRGPWFSKTHCWWHCTLWPGYRSCRRLLWIHEKLPWSFLRAQVLMLPSTADEDDSLSTNFCQRWYSFFSEFSLFLVNWNANTSSTPLVPGVSRNLNLIA